jgi:hypothetical protein
MTMETYDIATNVKKQRTPNPKMRARVRRFVLAVKAIIGKKPKNNNCKYVGRVTFDVSGISPMYRLEFAMNAGM